MKLRWPFLVSAALAASLAHAEIVERIVATANGGIVTLSEFEARQVAAVQGARVPPDQVEAYLRDNNQRILQEAIDDVILVQRGLAQGIKVRPEYLDEIVEGIKKDNNITTDEELQQQLRREGLSLGELRRNIERSIIKRQVLARELEPKAAVTDAEARAEYDRNLERYQRPASIQLLEIVVPTEARAKELAARARGGADFATLARAHSTAPSRDRGGDLGTVTHGDLAPALEAVAFKLPLGGVSDPMPAGDDGFRIVKVAARNEASTASFEEMKPALQQQLAQTKMVREYDAYMQKLRAEVQDTVRIMVREVATTVDPDAAAAPALSAPGTAPTAPTGTDDEISTTPQARPQRVVPPGTPASPAPPPAGEEKQP